MFLSVCVVVAGTALRGVGHPCNVSILSGVSLFMQHVLLQVDNGSLKVAAFL